MYRRIACRWTGEHDGMEIDKLPPARDRNGHGLCSDGRYRDISDPTFNAGRALIEKLSREIRDAKDVQWMLGEMKNSNVKKATA